MIWITANLKAWGPLSRHRDFFSLAIDCTPPEMQQIVHFFFSCNDLDHDLPQCLGDKPIVSHGCRRPCQETMLQSFILPLVVLQKRKRNGNHRCKEINSFTLSYFSCLISVGLVFGLLSESLAVILAPIETPQSNVYGHPFFYQRQ